MAIQIGGTTVIDNSRNIQNIGVATVTSSLNVGTGGTIITTTASGLVGIGTTNPQSTLQIGTGITFFGSTGIVSAVSFRGDGSLLSGVSGGVSISTNTTSRSQYIPYVTSFGSTTGLGATISFVYNPSTNSLGIGTTNPSGQLQVGTALTLSSTGNATFAGIVTASNFKGDGTGLRSVDGQSFNTGISTSLTTTLTGIGDYVLTLPSTTGVKYIIHSILASNIGTGNTEFQAIGAFDIFGGERSYFAYNVPIPTGTSLELLKQPQILNPSDKIAMRSTDYNRVGIDSSIQVYISYESKTDTSYFGVGLGTIGIAVTDLVTAYTSATYSSTVQSIRLVNRTDSAGYPISVSILRSGQSNPLVNNLIVPKYASVELLDAQKKLFPNDQIQVQVLQSSTIDVQISGKQLIP